MFTRIEVQHVVGTLMFLFGFLVQHRSLSLLAGLRKNRGNAQYLDEGTELEKEINHKGYIG